MRMLICTGWATLVRVPQIQLFGVFSFGPNQFELHTKDKLAAWSYVHGIQKLYSTNYVMTWESLTLDNFRYDLCSLHNDMGGSYERCSRQNHGEGGKGKQAKPVQHLIFFM